MSSVSYIVPVFNGARYLAEALESILRQTLQPLEVIVVDDGSTDDTAEIARRYEGRIVYVPQAHAGQSAARNHGIQMTRGELIAFLDADDLVDPRKLERQVARFDARPEMDLCQAYTRNFWSPDVPVEQRRDDPQWTRLQPRALSTWLVRRSLLDRIGGFDVEMKFSETVEWYWRAREAGALIELLPEVLAYRRVHRDNLTRRHRDEQVDGLIAVLRTALAKKRHGA